MTFLLLFCLYFAFACGVCLCLLVLLVLLLFTAKVCVLPFALLCVFLSPNATAPASPKPGFCPGLPSARCEGALTLPNRWQCRWPPRRCSTTTEMDCPCGGLVRLRDAAPCGVWVSTSSSPKHDHPKPAHLEPDLDTEAHVDDRRIPA